MEPGRMLPRHDQSTDLHTLTMLEVGQLTDECGPGFGEDIAAQFGEMSFQARAGHGERHREVRGPERCCSITWHSSMPDRRRGWGRINCGRRCVSGERPH